MEVEKNDAFYLVDNLKMKIEQLLKPAGENWLSTQYQEILKLVYKQVDSFEETAKTTIRSDLQRAISSEVRRLRGIVAELGSVHFSSDDDDDEEYDDDDDDDEYDDDDDDEEEEEEDDRYTTQDVEELKQYFDSFNRGLKELEQRCVDGLYNTFPDDEEDDDNHDTVTSKMIGARDVYEKLKHELKFHVLTSLVGMPGIGKTTIANRIFHDPTILEHFDHRVWVHVGKKCRAKDIPRRILAEIDPDMLHGVDDEEAVHECLKATLKISRYLIVIDDVWDTFVTYLLNPFFRYELNELEHPFLHSKSKSRILLTSRLQQINQTRSLDFSPCVVNMRLLTKEESWSLLCDKVFCEGLSCPPQLEKVGKKIAERCEGLPLTILTVARLLSEEEKSTPEYWKEVVAKKDHQLFKDAYDEISKVLLPSYTYLPPLLKMSFLYVGLFRKKYEIPRCKLINLWLVDRFVELEININSDSDAICCLEELVVNNVVMVYKKSTENVTHTVKTCGLHSSLWHLSKQKAGETKFALIISSPDDCLADGMEGHHRLSIHSNVLFGIKEVHQLLEDKCASAVRSLLCFGPYHQYQVPLCFRLKLLRELDALSIRFYEFPMEVLQLVWLTYLSLTSNGTIPASICQLKFLEFFSVDRHQSIKSRKNNASYLPVEIWSLPVLNHLQVMGSDLPDPCGASLDKLSTLSKVSAHSCTDVVLKGVPNLRELNIQIELTPEDDGKPLSCFAHVSQLIQLDSLKCVIVNPEVARPVVPFPSFPGELLRKLYLSGLCYPWKEMRNIALLPLLVVLKLKKQRFSRPNLES